MEQSGKVIINGISIRESIVGDGAPVLMIHGWGANIELLAPLALPLSRLGYRCHMIDLPGFGESEVPPQPYSIFDYAALCADYLDNHRLSQVNYFGHSLGGRIGLILASDCSARIRKLVLSNSAGIKSEATFPARIRLSAYQSARRSPRVPWRKVSGRPPAQNLWSALWL